MLLQQRLDLSINKILAARRPDKVQMSERPLCVLIHYVLRVDLSDGPLYVCGVRHVVVGPAEEGCGYGVFG